jgi:hypothetical protein
MLNWDRISIGRGSEPPVFMKGGLEAPPLPFPWLRRGSGPPFMKFITYVTLTPLTPPSPSTLHHSPTRTH